ncbi:hypothetical protein M758_6G098200 [Ceratodon purpureus]|nr:hypothetical protein M758_6G098200 [Ceratodon purpureus]
MKNICAVTGLIVDSCVLLVNEMPQAVSNGSALWTLSLGWNCN